MFFGFVWLIFPRQKPFIFRHPIGAGIWLLEVELGKRPDHPSHLVGDHVLKGDANEVKLCQRARTMPPVKQAPLLPPPLFWITQHDFILRFARSTPRLSKHGPSSSLPSLALPAIYRERDRNWHRRSVAPAPLSGSPISSRRRM